jgi:hypothetical protein
MDLTDISGSRYILAQQIHERAVMALTLDCWALNDSLYVNDSLPINAE